MANESSQALFHIHNISKIYTMGDVQANALRGVDFDLWAGEFVVILGASGSGKSTLLNILGGLDVPSSMRPTRSRRPTTGPGRQRPSCRKPGRPCCPPSRDRPAAGEPSACGPPPPRNVPVLRVLKKSERVVNWCTFVLQQGRVQRRTVTVGHRNQGEAEILNGLFKGETVVLHPSNQLDDGMRVREQ